MSPSTCRGGCAQRPPSPTTAIPNVRMPSQRNRPPWTHHQPRAEEIPSTTSTETTTTPTPDAQQSVSNDIAATIGVTVFFACVLIGVGFWMLRRRILKRRQRQEEGEDMEQPAAPETSEAANDDFLTILGQKPELEGSRVAYELDGVVAPKELEVIEKPVELGGTPRAELETCWNDTATWSALQQLSPVSPASPSSSGVGGTMRSSTIVLSPLPSSATMSMPSPGELSPQDKEALRFSPYASLDRTMSFGFFTMR
jgi:hypothetical protein